MPSPRHAHILQDRTDVARGQHGCSSNQSLLLFSASSDNNAVRAGKSMVFKADSRGARCRTRDTCRCREFRWFGVWSLPCGITLIQHGQKAGWRHDRDGLERMESEQILIPTDDHLGTAADCHL